MLTAIRMSGISLVVGFTGTQIGMVPAQKLGFMRLLSALRPLHQLHHGDCIGADAQAHEIFDVKGKGIAIHPPINPSKRANCKCKNANRLIFPPFEYLERNRYIVDASSLLIATPQQETGEELRSGTWSTVRYARKEKKPVFIVRPSGKIFVSGAEPIGIKTVGELILT